MFIDPLGVGGASQRSRLKARDLPGNSQHRAKSKSFQGLKLGVSVLEGWEESSRRWAVCAVSSGIFRLSGMGTPKETKRQVQRRNWERACCAQGAGVSGESGTNPAEEEGSGCSQADPSTQPQGLGATTQSLRFTGRNQEGAWPIRRVVCVCVCLIDCFSPALRKIAPSQDGKWRALMWPGKNSGEESWQQSSRRPWHGEGGKRLESGCLGARNRKPCSALRPVLPLVGIGHFGGTVSFSPHSSLTSYVFVNHIFRDLETGLGLAPVCLASLELECEPSFSVILSNNTPLTSSDSRSLQITKLHPPSTCPTRQSEKPHARRSRGQALSPLSYALMVSSLRVCWNMVWSQVDFLLTPSISTPWATSPSPHPPSQPYPHHRISRWELSGVRPDKPMQ